MTDQTTTIPKGWKMTTLGEVANIVDGDRGVNYPKNEEFYNEGYCLFLNAKNVPNDTFSFEEKMFVDKKKDLKLRKGKLKRGDFVLTTRGTVGNFAFYSNKVPFENIRINSGMVIIRVKEDFLDIGYLNFYLKSSVFKKQVITLSSGTAQPQLPIRDLSVFQLFLPPLPEQYAIAAVLSSFDDKIELLREQNKTLEAIAQTIFKEWFVNFNFPDADGKPYKTSGRKMIDSELGAIPEGWRVGKLTELFDFIKGIEPGSINYSVKKLSENYLPFYRVQDTSNYNETPNVFVDKRVLNGKIFKKDDTLISLDGTIGRVFIGGSGGYSSGIRKVVGKESFISKFLIYCFLKSDKFQGELNSFSGAETTIKHAGGAIDHIKFVFEKSICEEFGNITNPLFQKMVFNNSQIQTLSKLRDTLLPKLMKGEIRVKF